MARGSDDRDEAWFDRLYRDWHGSVLAYARRRVAEPDDLVADVFTAAWRHRTRVSTPPLPWLLRTARNYSLHAARSGRRRDRLTARVATAGAAEQQQADHADVVAEQHAAASTVLPALATLTAIDQELLRLAAWEQLLIGEIAYVMECSEPAARVRLHRARRRLAAAVDRLQPPAVSAELTTEVRS